VRRVALEKSTTTAMDAPRSSTIDPVPLFRLRGTSIFVADSHESLLAKTQVPQLMLTLKMSQRLQKQKL